MSSSYTCGDGPAIVSRTSASPAQSVRAIASKPCPRTRKTGLNSQALANDPSTLGFGHAHFGSFRARRRRAALNHRARLFWPRLIGRAVRGWPKNLPQANARSMSRRVPCASQCGESPSNTMRAGPSWRSPLGDCRDRLRHVFACDGVGRRRSKTSICVSAGWRSGA